jgi:hypothetical protein
MDKVHKASNSECCPPSSEPFRFCTFLSANAEQTDPAVWPLLGVTREQIQTPFPPQFSTDITAVLSRAACLCLGEKARLAKANLPVNKGLKQSEWRHFFVFLLQLNGWQRPWSHFFSAVYVVIKWAIGCRIIRQLLYTCNGHCIGCRKES